MQQSDGFDVCFEFCLGSSCAKIIVCDTEIDRLLIWLCRRLLRGIRVQRQIFLFPCLVDLFRGHRLAGKGLNSIICRRTMDSICPGLHICDKLHLFRAKFRIQQFFQTAAILRNSIDYIHLFRRKILVGHTCIVQGHKDGSFYRFFQRHICLLIQMPNIILVRSKHPCCPCRTFHIFQIDQRIRNTFDFIKAVIFQIEIISDVSAILCRLLLGFFNHCGG